ncbi:MAG: hypothetical protein WA982_01885 [Rubrobacteraceae bacterium]
MQRRLDLWHDGPMSGEAEFAFTKLYEQWRSHDLKYHKDLGSIRPRFYEDLRPEDESQVWRFVEQNYLLRYDEFMAVRFDWSSSGLWSIPFPGSVSDKWNFSDLEAMGLSERARRLLKEWHDPLDDMRRLDDDSYFDYEISNARGLAAAKEVKLSLREGIYLEFRPFQEIVIVDGEAKELMVPEYIREVSQGGQRPERHP